MTAKKALYPGSFDPITFGHLDVIERVAPLFSEVVVGIGVNDEKASLFSADERVSLIHKACGHLTNVRAVSFSGLTVDFAKENGIEIIVRGIRNQLDYEYEFQMAMANRTLALGLETIFLPTSQEFCHISSRLVREIAKLGGEVSRFVPRPVAEALKECFAAS